MSLVAAALLLLATPGQVETSSADGHTNRYVAFLVDASSSMTWGPTPIYDRERFSKPRVGSDVARIRYDAVELMSRMLAIGDKLLILRFNHECPPKYGQGNGAAFLNMRAERFDPKVHEFPTDWISVDDAGLRKVHDYCRIFNQKDDLLDYDGTNILSALKVLLKHANRLPANSTIEVVLLTDGVDNEWKTKMEENPDDARKWLEETWRDLSKDLEQRRMIVHCVMLAANLSAAEISAGEEFLMRLANLSGGEYHKISSNHELIMTIFHLVKNMRGLWYRTEDVSANGSKTLELSFDKIAEFSGLVYEYNPMPQKQDLKWKTTRFPKISPVWNPELADMSQYKGNWDVYSFIKSQKPRGQSRLTLSASDWPLAARLLKSTVEPILVLESPKKLDYDRYEALEIRVLVKNELGFSSEQFEVNAQIRAPEGDILFETKLELNAKENAFYSKIDLSNLRILSKEADLYILSIYAVGVPTKNGESHPLEGFRFDFGERVIKVNNRLQLCAESDVGIIKHPRDELNVNLYTKYPIACEQIVLSVKHVASVVTDSLPIIPPQVVLNKDAQCGRGKLQLRYAANTKLIGGTKGDVTLSFADPQGKVAVDLDPGPLKVDVAIQLAKFKLLNEKDLRLKITEGGGCLTVTIGLEDNLGPWAKNISVYLQSNQIGENGVQLWLAQAQSVKGTRLKDLSIGDTFEICGVYRLPESANRREPLSATLRLEGEGVQSKDVPLVVDVIPVSLNLDQLSIPTVSPGGKVQGVVKARLSEGAHWPRRVQAQLDLPVGLSVGIGELDIMPNVDVEIPILVLASPSVTCGQYKVSGTLLAKSDANQPPITKPFDVEVKVDTLVLEMRVPQSTRDGDGGPRNVGWVWKELDSDDLLELFEIPSVRALRVRTALNEQLKKHEVLATPLGNASQRAHILPAPGIERVDVSNEYRMTMPSVSTAFQHSPYKTTITVSAEGYESRVVSLNVWFRDLGDLFSVERK
jgi:hypothetical protein